jgi:oxygen-dependent protoporphyrinogen oxidase
MIPMRPLSPTPHVAVLGGGITGLTAAWQLQRAGFTPVVFEKSGRVGGAIGSLRIDRWLHELGPNSMLEGAPELARFIEEVGLGERRVYAAPEAARRYIVRDGRPVAMPGSPVGFLTTRLFTPWAKFALLGEPFRRRAPADAEESVAEFVERRLGSEFLDYAVNPFVGGVYAGDPRRLSVRYGFPKLHALEQEHGSLLRGALARRNTSGGPKGRMFSFLEGMEELPRALARPLGDRLRLSSGVRTLRPHGPYWELAVEQGGVVHHEMFSAVVCALPADALARLRFEGVPPAQRLDRLSEIEHPPVASVFMGFRREDVAHPLDGFGLLVPEVEHGHVLGTLFSSTLFPGRAPTGHVALTTFVGGTRQPEIAGLADGPLHDLVRGELSRLLGVRADPTLVHVQRWPRAIPQYTLDYHRHKDAIAAFEASAPGLFIGGNARDGISLANCIQSGQRLAAAACAHLQGSNPSVREFANNLI